MVAGFHIESVDITLIHSSPTVIVGTTEKITFICDVKVLSSGPCENDKIMFRWIKDGSETFAESSQQVILAENFTIHHEMAVINREIVVTDAGLYQCQAQLPDMPVVNSSTAQNISVTSKYI